MSTLIWFILWIHSRRANEYYQVLISSWFSSSCQVVGCKSTSHDQKSLYKSSLCRKECCPRTSSGPFWKDMQISHSLATDINAPELHQRFSIQFTADEESCNTLELLFISCNLSAHAPQDYSSWVGGCLRLPFFHTVINWPRRPTDRLSAASE